MHYISVTAYGCRVELSRHSYEAQHRQKWAHSGHLMHSVGITALKSSRKDGYADKAAVQAIETNVCNTDCRPHYSSAIFWEAIRFSD